eukprot:6210435-Pleurochrysis_carterae.AAC.1
MAGDVAKASFVAPRRADEPPRSRCGRGASSTQNLAGLHLSIEERGQFFKSKNTASDAFCMSGLGRCAQGLRNDLRSRDLALCCAGADPRAAQL